MIELHYPGSLHNDIPSIPKLGFVKRARVY